MDKKEAPEIRLRELEEQIKEEECRLRQIQKRQKLILRIDAIILAVILTTFALRLFKVIVVVFA